MENNFIPMAALAGPPVAYTIAPIFKHIIDCVASWILFLACERNTYLWRHTPQIIVQRCQIPAPRWSNDISSAADNAIFKNRAQNIECSFCVARKAVLLLLLQHLVANILLFNFYEQKFFQRGPITIVIDCNGLSLLIFE